MLQNLKVIEDDEEKGTSIIYYQIKTPAFIQTRDAVVLKKTMKDFPSAGSLCVLHKSVDHPDYPEDVKKFVRIDMSIWGLVFEDAPEIKGTKVTWVMQNDIRGSVPKSIINSRMVKNPKMMIHNLNEACHKIVKGML